MLKVLHTIDTTGPGGAESVFVALASKLDASRFRSVAALVGPGWVQEELRRRGIDARLLKVARRSAFDIGYLRQLCGIVQRERIDLIHSHLFGSNVYSSLAGLICRVPAISTFHGAVDIGGRQRLRAAKFAILRAGSAKAVFVSDHLRAQILPHARLPYARTARIYNGIDTGVYASGKDNALRRELGLGAEDVLVGALGNIRPAKGYDVLLEAAALAVANDARMKFVIAGHARAPLHEALLAQRARLGLDGHVFFLGFRSDTPRVLRGLDLFVLSSVSEGLSISTIEAMACGLPIVATRCGGPQEIVRDGDNGVLVDVRSPAQLAAAIARLAADVELRTRLSRNALAAAARFSEARMIAAYEELYDEVMRTRRHSAWPAAGDTRASPPKA